MKTLILDIETAPHMGYVWGLWQQNIGLNQLIESGYVLCWAAKWLDEPHVWWMGIYESTPEQMLEEIHKLLDEADNVVHFNGKRFDIPVLNKEFVLKGLYPPSPYKQTDLYETVKRVFKFASNKLAYVAKVLGCGEKIETGGFELWTRCMDGDPSAWKEIESYNVNDVLITEQVYKKLLPWIPNHPNHNLFSGGEHVCPNCGGKHLQRRGIQHLIAGSYQRYKCTSCKKWSRGTHKIKGSVMVRGA